MKYVSLSTLLVGASVSLFTMPAFATPAENLPTPSQQTVVQPELSGSKQPNPVTPTLEPSRSNPTSSESNSPNPTSPESVNPTHSNSSGMDAETLPESIPEEELIQQLTQQIRIVPQNTALVLSFPNDTQVTLQKDGRSVLAVPLAQPLFDHQGQVAIPAGAIAQLQLSSTGEDIQLSATELVIAGQVTPIKSSSIPLGSTTLSQTSRSPVTRSTNRPWGLLGRYTTPPFASSSSSLLNQAISTTTELMFERTYTGRTHVVNIPAQSTFVLTLQEDIVLLGH